MSEFGSPVAGQSQPQSGLATLGDLMSLRTSVNQQALQRQALQTGQYQQQSAQATAQQDQIKAQQQQGVQSFFQQWDPTQHLAPDGTTDTESVHKDPAYQNAGIAKPAIDEALLGIKQRQLQAKSTLAGLNDSLLNQYSKGVGALAKDPDVVADTTDPVTGVNAGRAKVDAFNTNFGKLSPDAARVAQTFGPITTHAPPGKLSGAIQAQQMMGEDVASQQGQQNPEQLAVQRGGSQDIYNVQKAQG